MNIALILASGYGTRMGQAEYPKQFLDVDGLPLMLISTTTFQNHPQIDEIYIVTNEEYISLVKEWIDDYQLTKVKAVVPGGITRLESVRNGLYAIEADQDDIVLIHDSARALVSEEIITDNILECYKYDAVVTVLPATDTIVTSKSDIIEEMPNRSELYVEQTPQTFKYGLICQAHELYNGKEEVTDDCKLVYLLGYDIHFVRGSKKNFRITTKEDLLLLKQLMKDK